MRHLYIQVLLAMALGIALGVIAPAHAIDAKPLADIFIRLIRILVGPIIFVSIVHGVSSLPTMRDAGRIGGKALLYFLVMSGLSLVIGMGVANLFQPGAGLHAHPTTLAEIPAAGHVATTAPTVSEFLISLVPTSLIEPFLTNNILQIVVLALAISLLLLSLGQTADPVRRVFARMSQLLFAAMGYLMRIAPIAAFGAMAFTVGKYGLSSLLPLGELMLCFYLTCALFITLGLGLMLRSIGIPLWKLLRYIREEIFVTFATSSSESALPRLLTKLEEAGCAKSVVSMVLPTGYSFNLDGTAIYLSLAALFLAQATDTPMDMSAQLAMLGIMMLTSKGAAGVTGAGFIALSASLSTMNTIPLAALTLIIGIDRFMSEGRAVTNVIGNTVATLFIAHWEKKLDRTKLEAALG